MTVAIASSASILAAQSQTSSPQGAVEADHTVVVEFGAAGDWSRAEGLHPGGTVAVEMTPIEHWLEIETGVTAIRSAGSTETSVDLLAKKPWQFSRTVEFMAGAGPEVVHATGFGAATFWGAEVVADLMVWPRRNIGWYLEPGYEMTMRAGMRHQGLGIAAGLIVGR